MNWKELGKHIKADWEFHKRNPEMFLVWAVFVLATIYAFYQ